MASPNDTVVMAGSGETITDAAGNVWSISPGNLVLVDGQPAGYTAGASEIAYANGTIWHYNGAINPSTANWYLWTGMGWLLGSDPLPNTETTQTEMLATLVGIWGTLKEILAMGTTVGQDITQITTDVGTLTTTVQSLSTALTALITAFQGANVTPAQQAALEAADTAVQQANTALAADATAIAGAGTAAPSP